MKRLPSVLILLSLTSPILAQQIEVKEALYTVRPTYQKPLVRPARPAGPVIAGAGEIEFNFNPADFPVEMLKGEYGEYLDLELGFDADGRLISCLPFGYGYSSAPTSADRLFCDVAKTQMRFRYTPGYNLDAPAGYLAAKVRWNKRLFPAKPYRLISDKEGISVSGKILKGNKSRAGQCVIWTDGLSVSEKDDICAMLIKSPNMQTKLAAFWRKKPKSEYARSNEANFNVNIAAQNPRPAPESAVVLAQNGYDVAPDAYLYPNAVPKNMKAMPDTVGRFFLSPGFSERPDAGFEKWQRKNDKVSLVLEIAPDGSVAGCKPLLSSYYAALDLKSCTLAKERGRFVFTEGVPISEPHYLLTEIEWPAE